LLSNGTPHHGGGLEHLGGELQHAEHGNNNVITSAKTAPP